ncbi:MAG: glycosyltransferase [Thiobacillaceae bacterium]
MPTVLWWGRFDADYARNRILRQAFGELGWEVLDFRPHLSALGDVEALLRRLPRPDLVWVPCFRQRDLAAARRWSRRQGLPMVADPLISAYDKQVEERAKYPSGSRAARRLLAWEARRLAAADLVIADTAAHADYFHDRLGISAARLHVIPVGAEEALFRPCPEVVQNPAGVLRVLFYGSYVPLQGPRVIVAAARSLRAEPIAFDMIGNGLLRAECERLARGLDNIRFTDWIPYAELPQRICAADVVLGIFGTTPKAGRVIPNKVYQALACGRTVVSRTAPVYPDALLASKAGILWVPPGDPDALAARLRDLAHKREGLPAHHQQARARYRAHFSQARVLAALSAALDKLFERAAR